MLRGLPSLDEWKSRSDGSGSNVPFRKVQPSDYIRKGFAETTMGARGITVL